VSYVDELAGELRRVGIRGTLRRRIVAEIADHLASDPSAALGTPGELARRFADELGTSRTRRAAFAVFAALGVAGVAYTVVFAAAAEVQVSMLHARTPLIGVLAGATAIVAPQVAFVTGLLAGLRAFRRRRDATVSAGDARILRRRTGLALASGLATMSAVALLVYEYTSGLPAWLTTLAYACAAVGGAALLAATPAVLSATRLRVSAAGEPADMFADLGPLVPAGLRQPWTFARAVAALLFLLVTFAGIVQSDPVDGALRGLAEGVAVLAGFSILGGYLGLRRE